MPSFSTSASIFSFASSMKSKYSGMRPFMPAANTYTSSAVRSRVSTPFSRNQSTPRPSPASDLSAASHTRSAVICSLPSSLYSSARR